MTNDDMAMAREAWLDTLDAEAEKSFKPRAVVGQLCVCGEDLGEPDNPQQGWQDWEQCPNCDLHVHHAEWINKMVVKNDELTVENARLKRFDVEMATTDDDGNLVGCGMDLLDWQAHLQTKLGLSLLKNVELEGRVQHLELTLGLEDSWDETEYTFFADYLVARVAELKKVRDAVQEYYEGKAVSAGGEPNDWTHYAPPMIVDSLKESE